MHLPACFAASTPFNASPLQRFNVFNDAYLLPRERRQLLKDEKALAKTQLVIASLQAKLNGESVNKQSTNGE